jgi:hypothetical protein
MNSMELLFIIIGMISGLYFVYILGNQLIYLLAMIIHWWEDLRS